jgi:hypothetical protein
MVHLSGKNIFNPIMSKNLSAVPQCTVKAIVEEDARYTVENISDISGLMCFPS